MSNQAPNSAEVPPKSSEVEETAKTEMPAAEEEETALDGIIFKDTAVFSRESATL